MADDNENITPSPTAARIGAHAATPERTMPPKAVQPYYTGRLPTPSSNRGESTTPEKNLNDADAYATPPDSRLRPAAKGELQHYTIFEDAQSQTSESPNSRLATPTPRRRLREIASFLSEPVSLATKRDQSSREADHLSDASYSYRVDTEEMAEWNRLTDDLTRPGSATINAASTASAESARSASDAAAAALSGPTSKRRFAETLDDQIPVKSAKMWHDDVDLAAFGPEGSKVRAVADKIVTRSQIRTASRTIASAFRNREQTVVTDRSNDVRRSSGIGPPALSIDPQSGRAYVNIPIPYHITPPPQRNDNGLKFNASLPVYGDPASSVMQDLVNAGRRWVSDKPDASDNIEPSHFIQGQESLTWLSESLEADRLAAQRSRAGTPEIAKGCDRSSERSRSRGR
jgi:hypothetical protein